MAAAGAKDATSPPPVPQGTGDPVADVNNAWEWARGFFNSRAFGYELQMAGQLIALGAALRG